MASTPTITASFGAPFETKAAALVTPSGLANAEPWLINWGGAPAIAGGPLSPSQALQVPTVQACVVLISSAIGALPCRVFKVDDKQGGRVEAPEHPAFPLVFEDANEWTEAAQFRAQLVMDALLHGNGYAYVQRDGDGNPSALLHLKPGSVSIFVHPETWEPIYKVADLAGLETVTHRDMIHVRAPIAQDAITGTSPIWHAREAISLAIALERHASRIMRNGARPSGVLTFPEKMTPEGVRTVRQAFETQHVGEHSGKPAVLYNGATWTPNEFKSVDAQYMEQRQFQITEIAKAFGVPPTLIGELAKATLSNSETMGRQFLTTTLSPWINALRSAYRRTMIEPENRKAYSIEFDVSALLRPDSAQRAAFAASMRAAGIMTANEARRIEHLPDRPDGDSLVSPHVAPAPASNPDKTDV